MLAVADLDTAAQVSVLNINRAREWVKLKNKKSTSSYLRGIGKSLLPAKIVQVLQFTIGDEYSSAFYLAEIADMLIVIEDLFSE